MWLQNYFLWITVASLYYPGGFSAPTKTSKVIPAALFAEISDLVTYEGTTELVFHVEFNADFKNEHHSFSTLEKNPRRVKRVPIAAIGVGVVAVGAGFLFSKVTSSLFGNDATIRAHLDAVKNSVIEQHQDLVVLETVVRNVTSYLDEMDTILHTAIANISKEIKSSKDGLKWIYGIVKANRASSLFRHSESACMRRLIPTELISEELLQMKLSELSNILGKSSRTLAIAVARQSAYLKLPLVDCYISEGNFTVILNVPIRRSSSNWRMHEVFHSKFSYLGQTCELYPQEVQYVAVSGNRTVAFDSRLMNYCSILEHKICLIPEFNKDSSEDIQCISSILSGKSVVEISGSCAFRCSKNTDLIVSQLPPNLLVLTNADHLAMNCSGIESSFNFEKLGAVHLRLGCNCSYLINGNFWIYEPLFCFNNAGLEEGVYHVIPNLWSTLHHTYGTLEHNFQKFDGVLNPNWPNKIPVFNFTAGNIENDLNFSDSVIQNPWLSSITLVIFIMVLIVLFLLKKLMC